MRLSTKGRFAVASLIDVALRGGTGPVALSAISQRQRVSLSYLEQLFSKLRTAGLVESTRGPGGGYSLARAASDISLADVMVAVDAMDDQAGEDDRSEDPAGNWTQSAVWAGVNARMLDYMRSVSLASLLEEQGPAVEPEPNRSFKKAVFERPKTEAVRARGPNSVFALGQFATAARR